MKKNIPWLVSCCCLLWGERGGKRIAKEGRDAGCIYVYTSEPRDRVPVCWVVVSGVARIELCAIIHREYFGGPAPGSSNYNNHHRVWYPLLTASQARPAY